MKPTLPMALLGVAFAVAGCSTPPTPGPAVASLPSTATAPSTGASTNASTTSAPGASPADAPSNPRSNPPSTTAPSDDSARDRPQLRLDDSDERRQTLFDAYATCLLKHGASPARSGMTAGGPVRPGVLVQRPVPTAATAACVTANPLPPPELDAATNPRFHDQSLAYVACLRTGGLYVQLTDDHSLDWTYVEGKPVPADTVPLERRCLQQSFGGGR